MLRVAHTKQNFAFLILWTHFVVYGVALKDTSSPQFSTSYHQPLLFNSILYFLPRSIADQLAWRSIGEPNYLDNSEKAAPQSVADATGYRLISSIMY